MNINKGYNWNIQAAGIAQHEMLFFDLECDGLTPTKIHCIVIIDGLGTVRRFSSEDGTIEDGLVHLSRAKMLIGHNIIGFDMPALYTIYPDFTVSGCIRDTLVLSRLLWPHMRDIDFKRKDFPKASAGSHSLKAWGLRLDMNKIEYGGGDDSAWDEWSEEMEDYCVRDVEITKKLWNKISAEGYKEDVIEMEHEFHELMEVMSLTGFKFNRQNAEKLYVRLKAEQDQILATIRDTFPPKKIELKTKTKEIPFNPGSRVMIGETFMSRGWEPTEFTPDGRPKISETILSELSEVYPEAEMLKKYLLIQKRIGMLAEGKNAWLELVGADDRMHGRVISCGGTVSHRCAHHSPNISQVPAVGSAYGKECRSLFTTEGRCWLVGTDYSSLELAVLAHYLYRWDDGAFAMEVEDGDIHTRNMEVAGLKSRAHAKTLIYALLYGAGDQKLGEIVGGGRSEGSRLRRRFMSKTPALKMLTNAVKEKARRKGKLTALDGRPLYVRSPHSALNLLIQSAGAILVKRGTLMFCDSLEFIGLKMMRDWAIVAHVHDEWQTECVKEYAEQVAEIAESSVMVSGEFYNLKCTLSGETKIGNTWADTH